MPLGQLVITVSIAAALFFAGNFDITTLEGSTPHELDGHYYDVIEFLPIGEASARLSFEEARAEAKTRFHNGLRGHLLTMTTQAQQNFINSAFSSHPRVPLLGQTYIKATQTGEVIGPDPDPAVG
jgi:hypothetical protein